MTSLDFLADSIAAGWEPPFRGEIYDFARTIDLQNGYAIKGPFEIEKTKYLIEPLQALRNPRIRTVIIPALFTLIGPRIWWPALREDGPSRGR